MLCILETELVLRKLTIDDTLSGVFKNKYRRSTPLGFILYQEHSAGKTVLECTFFFFFNKGIPHDPTVVFRRGRKESQLCYLHTHAITAANILVHVLV